jgi:hypothetical protein
MLIFRSFVWSMTTVILNRSLFRIRRAKMQNDKLGRGAPLLQYVDAISRPSSPVGIQSGHRADASYDRSTIDLADKQQSEARDESSSNHVRFGLF